MNILPHENEKGEYATVELLKITDVLKDWRLTSLFCRTLRKI
jgi:hypothetical protein